MGQYPDVNCGLGRSTEPSPGYAWSETNTHRPLSNREVVFVLREKDTWGLG